MPTPPAEIKKLLLQKYENKVRFHSLVPIKTVDDFHKWISENAKIASKKKKNIFSVYKTFNPLIESLSSQNRTVKNIKVLLATIAKYFKRKMIYTRELPDLEVVNIDLAYILYTPRFRGDCDDAAFLIGTTLLILNNLYSLGLKVYVDFTSHHEGAPLHHAYISVTDKPGNKYIIDIVRSHRRTLPVYKKITTKID